MSSSPLLNRGKDYKLVLGSGRSPPAPTLHLGKPALRASRGPSAGQAAAGAGRPGPGLTWARQQRTGRAGKATRRSPRLAPEAGRAPQASPRASSKNDRRASESLARPTASCWSNTEGTKGGEGSRVSQGGRGRPQGHREPPATRWALPLQELRTVSREESSDGGCEDKREAPCRGRSGADSTRGARGSPCCARLRTDRMWESSPPSTSWVVFCLNT